MKPQRIQLSRAKGWRMPENTVKVDRSGKWGNPFTVSTKLPAGRVLPCYGYVIVACVEHSIECYREMVDLPEWADRKAEAMAELRGKNLACWCKLGTPCHADVLLELANREG